MFLVLGALVVVNLYVFVWDKHTSVAAIKREAEAKTATPMAQLPAQPLDAGSAAVHAPARPAIEGTVGKSDTLGRLLKKNGLTGAESDEVIRSLEPVLDFRTIRAGQSFRIERAADGRVQVFELDVGKHRVRTERAANGSLAARIVT